MSDPLAILLCHSLLYLTAPNIFSRMLICPNKPSCIFRRSYISSKEKNQHVHPQMRRISNSTWTRLHLHNATNLSLPSMSYLLSRYMIITVQLLAGQLPMCKIKLVRCRYIDISTLSCILLAFSRTSLAKNVALFVIMSERWKAFSFLYLNSPSEYMLSNVEWHRANALLRVSSHAYCVDPIPPT